MYIVCNFKGIKCSIFSLKNTIFCSWAQSSQTPNSLCDWKLRPQITVCDFLKTLSSEVADPLSLGKSLVHPCLRYDFHLLLKIFTETYYWFPTNFLQGGSSSFSSSVFAPFMCRFFWSGIDCHQPQKFFLLELH